MNTDEKFNKLEIDSTDYETRLTKKFLKRKPYEKVDPLKLTAYIPGSIRKIFVKEGSAVNPGDPLLLLVAMKMENIVRSDLKGKVIKIFVKEGDPVTKNQLLIELE